MARGLVTFLAAILCFAQTNVDAQPFSTRQQATSSEPRIGGANPTSPTLSSAVPGQWAVASSGTPSQQATGWNSKYDVVAGTENTAEHRGAWWSTTEAHFQYGKLKAPTFAGGRSSYTRILTIQHTSGWKYGDNYFFLDLYNDGIRDGFNDDDVYLEWFSNFSLGKIFGRRVGFGRIRDVGVLAGINYGSDANFLKWLPGLRFSWDLPGFTFFNTDFTAFIDDNAGLRSSGIPATSSTFMVDLNWALPFSIGTHDFSIEGHAEFVGDRSNELSSGDSWWFLAQPQFRYDAGKMLLGCPKKLFVGVEWQIWINKFGDPQTDENALQALVVWRF